MSKKVKVTNSVSATVADYIRQESVDWQIVDNGDSDIVIESSTERKECIKNIIYSNGWMSCEEARSLAPKLNLTLGQMGRLLDILSVKIRHCSLGCFK